MELENQKNKIQAKVIEELCNTIGRDNVFDDIERRVCYSYDATNEKSVPGLVIRPHSTQQVSSILLIANTHNLPIFHCGAVSGLSGGTFPVNGGIVLDLKNMNRIVELNPRDLTVTVEPGVVAKDLQDEARKFRLFYPPEQGNVDFSTIGGIVAESTGGMTGMKYGVTRDYVLALEIVLPDGSVINTGRKILKSVAGYDLTRFFVGSEGTLGIFTKITLKLLPLPAKTGTVMSFFKDIDSAMNATGSILISNHLHPRSLEFVDKTCIDAARGSIREKIPNKAEALLLIDVDGNEENVTNDLSTIETICGENSALNVLISKTDEERTVLLDIRQSIYQTLINVTSMEFNEDLYVPRSKVRGVLKKVYELGKLHAIRVVVYGYVGEGHIHLKVICNNGEEVGVSIRKLISQVLNEVAYIDGARTGFEGLEQMPQEIEIMKDLKKMFDPKNIMNPGKIFV